MTDWHLLPHAATSSVHEGDLVLRWENESRLRFDFDNGAHLLVRGIRFAAPGIVHLNFGTFEPSRIEFEKHGIDPSVIGQHDNDHALLGVVRERATSTIKGFVAEACIEPIWAERFVDMVLARSTDLLGAIDELSRDDSRRFDNVRESMISDRVRMLDGLDQALLRHSHPFDEGFGYVVLLNDRPVENPKADPYRWSGAISRYVHVHAGEAYQTARRHPDSIVERVVIQDQAVMIVPRSNGDLEPLSLDQAGTPSP